MQIDITRLKSGIETEIVINEALTIEKEQLEGTDLTELKEVQVEGNITRNGLDDYILNLTISGTMIIPCAVTLKPVSYPFSILVEGNIKEMLEEMGEIDKKMENTIDIFPIIWENILVEIPCRVVSEDAENISLEGNGWRLITEEQNEEINPELQKLKDLLK